MFVQLYIDNFQNLSEVDAFLGKYINFQIGSKINEKKNRIYDNHMRNGKCCERAAPPNASDSACFIIELIPGGPYNL